MDHNQVRQYWDGNADVWTQLARAGYDVCRDHLNTPAFMQMLPDMLGQEGLDIGCGEGHNTRLVTERGARMTALDISEVFVRHGRRMEQEQPCGIAYLVGSAVKLPFADATFDFATAFMCLMDIAETGVVLAEVHRVLRPGAWLQFSITHPCFDTPHRRNLRNEQGVSYAVEVGDYFRNLEGQLTEWLFSAAPSELRAELPPFRIPRFTRTLSQWLNLLIRTGFVLEQVEEPRPDDETVRRCPGLQDAQVVALFLHLRVRKPSR
jgi:ubiquinone/menaquinone biosynthesis C-methylase UbiE